MGVMFSNIMQRSKPMFWPTDKKSDAPSIPDSNSKLPSATLATPDSEIPSTSHHSPDDVSADYMSNNRQTILSHHSRLPGGSSTSTSSTSSMDCKTNAAIITIPNQINMDISVPACATTPYRDQRTVAEKQQIQTSKGRHETFDKNNPLHRCSSEPLSRVAQVHRTRSDMPLPDPKTLCEAHSVPHTLSMIKPNLSTKHMEGWLHEPNSFSSKHPTCEHVGSKTEMDVVSRSHSNSTTSSLHTDGSWITTSSSDGEEDNNMKLGAIPKLTYDPHMDKLVRHMDYVVTVLKKKMSSLVFTNNRALFLTKILTHQEVQFGYQGNKCIKIGSGEFGEVLYGRMRSTGQLIAIKALKKDKTDMFALLQEAFVLQIASDSDYAPKYLGLAPFNVLGDKFHEWAIIVEFVGNPSGPAPFDFRKTLRHVRTVPRTLQLLLEWVYTSAKIVHGVNQFHSMGILINDIKADNILLKPVGNGYHPIFIDFGLASIAEGITLALEVNDTNRAKILKEYSHIAPEVLFGGETNTSSDIFSLGKALSLVADTLQMEDFTQVINRCNLWNVSERPSAVELTENLQWVSNAAVRHFHKGITGLSN